MNPLPTPTLQDLRWKFLQSASNGTPFPSQTIQVATIAELESAAADMLQTQKALRDKNKDAKFGGAEGKYVQLSHYGYALRVTLEKVAKHTRTTATSRNAFHSQDFSTQAAQVAGCIFDHSEGDITRAEIADRLGIQEGRVSARVFALLKEYKDGGYTAPSGNYRLILTVPRLSRCPGASDKLNEAMRFESVKQPADEGAQFEMNF
jgi:hypothetical protein